MNNKERINLIENNIFQTRVRYDNGEINLNVLNHLNKQGISRIKELKQLIRNGKN